MQRQLTATIMLAVALVAAGCLEVAPGTEDVTPDGGPAGDLANAAFPGSSDPCVTGFEEPAFHPDAEVQEWSGDVPATAARGRVHVQSFFGGVYLVPWEKPRWRVEVGEVDPDDRLTPAVDAAVEDGVFRLTVTVEDNRGNGDGLPLFPTEQDGAYAQVKAWVPATLGYERVEVRDRPKDHASDSSTEDNAFPSNPEWTSVLTRDLTGGELSVAVTNLAVKATRLRVAQAGLSTVNGAVDAHAVVADGARASSTNGAVCASGVLARSLDASSTNGAVDVHDAEAPSVDASSTNGAISVARMLARDGTFSSTNGKVGVSLTPLASGDLTLSSTNGAVTLAVPAGAQYGYDVRGSTVNGQASADMEGASVDRGSDGKSFHARTDGYGQRDVQTQARLTSVNGNVHAETR